MLRIGDFSRLAQVSIVTLRHYDDVGLIKPAHIDRFTDYRYYTLDQLPRLNRILALKDLGFSLEQIVRLLNDNIPVEQMKGMLRLRQGDIERQIAEEQIKVVRIATRLRQIENENNPVRYDVAVKSLEALTIASTRQMIPNLFEMGRYRCAAYDRIYNTLAEYKIKNAGNEMALYHNHEYTETDIDTEMAVVIPVREISKLALAPIGTRQLPASPETACVVHQGATLDVTQAIIAVFEWIEANGYRCRQSETRELHYYGKENELQDLNAPVVMEIQVPVERIKVL
ncbi:MAG: MerR family transcriptional regulator [Anaerolineae bacterium]|nr:MerR family transcriptional regulator [Anaerolineae bacterium]